MGKPWPATPKARRTPSTAEIYWAAGIYEGEGTAGKNGHVSISQKDPWLLYQLQDLFGGTVRYWNQGTKRNYPIYAWRVCGARGRGFLYTIFTLLSPRRRAQIRRSLAPDTGGSAPGG